MRKMSRSASSEDKEVSKNEKQKNIKQKQRSRSGVPVLFLLLSTVVLAAGVTTGFWFYWENLFYRVCRVEAGVEVSVQDFLKVYSSEAYFAEESDPIDITRPGEYHIKIRYGILTLDSTLYVQDTISPAAQSVERLLELGEICEPMDLVSDIVDATEVSVGFQTEPDFGSAGEQNVTILLTDQGGNMTEVVSTLLISPVRPQVTREAGTGIPELEDFMLGDDAASFVENVTIAEMAHVGEHDVRIRSAGLEWTSRLCVADTVPPAGEVQDIEGFALVPREASDFVTWTRDATDVTVSFGTEPDLTRVGTQTVHILLTDEGGNVTDKQASLTLAADEQAPEITGVQDIEIYAGDAIAYRKNVEVTDDCPEGLEFTIDNSQVRAEEEGVYPVTYKAVDLAGNTTEITVEVIVHARMYALEDAEALADEVLEQILTPEMTPLEKVEAIYKYVTTHVSYINHSEKGDWIRGAYEGLAFHKGDCYVYACTTMELLNRAGISNMLISKIPTRNEHYWNLVDIGDGWYHLDTTPRVGDRRKIFMWTTEELIEFSNQNYRSHNYDPDLYPEIN